MFKHYASNAGNYVTLDRHLNKSTQNTKQVVKTAESIYGNGLKVSYKNPQTHRYCKPVVGCYVELSVKVC